MLWSNFSYTFAICYIRICSYKQTYLNIIKHKWTWWRATSQILFCYFCSELNSCCFCLVLLVLVLFCLSLSIILKTDFKMLLLMSMHLALPKCHWASKGFARARVEYLSSNSVASNSSVWEITFYSTCFIDSSHINLAKVWKLGWNCYDWNQAYP